MLNDDGVLSYSASLVLLKGLYLLHSKQVQYEIIKILMKGNYTNTSFLLPNRLTVISNGIGLTGKTGENHKRRNTLFTNFQSSLEFSFTT